MVILTVIINMPLTPFNYQELCHQIRSIAHLNIIETLIRIIIKWIYQKGYEEVIYIKCVSNK